MEIYLKKIKHVSFTLHSKIQPYGRILPVSTSLHMTSLHVFIISWAGQHENAIKISNEVLATKNTVSIVYSDPDPELRLNATCQLIKRPNELFWENKFKSCLDVCGDNPILIIHADRKCDDWSVVVESCLNSTSKDKRIGVWAPNISGTYYDLDMVRIGDISDSNLKVVALTDAIIFYLSSDVVARMRKINYNDNPFGWGIDILFCAYAHVLDYLVVMDEDIRVIHPKLRGYDDDKARSGMMNFAKQFSHRERIQAKLLLSFVKFNYSKI